MVELKGRKTTICESIDQIMCQMFGLMSRKGNRLQVFSKRVFCLYTVTYKTVIAYSSITLISKKQYKLISLVELWSGQPVLKQSFLFDILGEMSDTEHCSNMSPDSMVRFFCDLTMTLIEQSGLICCCRISLVMRSYLGHLVKTFMPPFGENVYS